MKMTEGLSLPTVYYLVTNVRRTLLVKIHFPAPGLKVQPLNLIRKPGPARAWDPMVPAVPETILFRFLKLQFPDLLHDLIQTLRDLTF